VEKDHRFLAKKKTLCSIDSHVLIFKNSFSLSWLWYCQSFFNNEDYQD